MRRPREARRFIRAFFDYWCAFPGVNGVIMLVKLEVTYRTPRARIARFLTRKAERLFRIDRKCFLPGLPDISESEARGWIEGNDDVREFLTGAMGFTTGEVRHHIHKAFEAGQKELLPMSELDPSVQGFLKQAYRERRPLTPS